MTKNNSIHLSPIFRSLASSFINRKTYNRLNRSEELFDKWRSCEFASAVFANLGVVTAIVDYEQNFSHLRTHDNCHEHQEKNAYKLITAVLTLMALIFLCLKSWHKRIWKKYLIDTEKLISRTSKIYFMNNINQTPQGKSINWPKIAEILLLFIFPYPFVNVYIYIPLRWDYKILYTCYTLDELLFAFMFIRILYLFKALANYSIYENHVARRYCAFHGIKANVKFSFKCILAQYALPVIILFVTIPTMFILAFMLRIFERPLEDLSYQDYQDPLNAVWLVFTTMSTIGFGDFVPISYFGRTILVIAFIIGAFILTMIIVTLEKQTDLSPNQFNVFNNIHNTKAAATSVCAAFEYYTHKQNRGPKDELTMKKKEQLFKKITDFKQSKLDLVELNSQKENEIIELKQEMKTIENKIKRLGRILESITESLYSRSLIINSNDDI